MHTPTREALTRPQKILIGIVAGGAVAIAGIGFAGSYTAVQKLAAAKGFGRFAHIFPIGIDAGIVVLLALDLLLTWFRMPYPLLRPAAWLLTAATVAFNAAAAWPDPLGVGMHAVIPVLFVVAVEAARHAIGRSADITADRHVERIPLRRWLLAPWPTFRLWRRMHLWQIRTLDEALDLEQQTLVYRTRLRAKHGRGWRRSAPVDSVLSLRLTRYGVALDGAEEKLTEQTAPVLEKAEPRAVEPAPPAAVAPQAEEPAPSTVRPAPAPPRPAAPHGAPPLRPVPPPADTARHDRTQDLLNLDGLSKAEAVRLMRKHYPDATAPQLVRRLAEHGIEAKDGYVRNVLSRDRQTAPKPAEGNGFYP